MLDKKTMRTSLRIDVPGVFLSSGLIIYFTIIACEVNPTIRRASAMVPFLRIIRKKVSEKANITLTLVPNQ